MPSGFQAFGNAEGFVGSVTILGPSDVDSATLVAWYEADDPTITLVSGKVSNWPNKKTPGTGDAAQATAGNRPTYTASSASYNGRPIVDATAATSIWLRGTGLSSVSQPYTVFLVGALPGTVGNILSDGQTQDTALVANNGGKWSYYAGTAYKDSTVSTTPNAAVFIVNGASSKAYVGKNTADNIGNPGASAFGNAVTLFNDGAHIFGGGQLACWCLYSGAVSEAQIQTILLQYAHQKYGFAIGA